MTVDRTKRFESATEIAVLLEEIPSPKRSFRRWVMVAGICGLILLMATGIGFSLLKKEVIPEIKLSLPPLATDFSEVLIAEFPENKIVSGLEYDVIGRRVVTLFEDGDVIYRPLPSTVKTQGFRARSQQHAFVSKGAKNGHSFQARNFEDGSPRFTYRATEGETSALHVTTKKGASGPAIRFQKGEQSRWEYESGNPEPVFEVLKPKTGITTHLVHFLRDPHFFATVSRHPGELAGIEIFELRKPDSFHEIGFRKGGYTCAAVSVFVKHLAVGASDGEVALVSVIDPKNVRIVKRMKTGNASNRLLTFVFHESRIITLQVPEASPQFAVLDFTSGKVIARGMVNELSEIVAAFAISRGDWFLFAGPKKEGTGYAVIAVETKLELSNFKATFP